MILPDVNVLIYAFRPDAPQHGLARAWLESVFAGDARFGMSPQVLSAVVRVTTNRRAFARPSSLEDVFAFCDALLSHPLCEAVTPSVRHWRIFESLCCDSATVADRVTDAWFAALAIEHGCTWITFDRDFARFPGLDWATPKA